MFTSTIISRYQKIKEFADKSAVFFPVSLFFITLITYGVFLSSLGFYWDDWPPILLSHIPDKAAAWNYFFYDRPFQSWTYYVLFPICKNSPFAWELSAIFFRWTSALVLYLTFLRVFPKQKTLLQWSAILFVVFPGFADLYASVSFGSHFMAYTVFALSLLTMLLSIQDRKRFWLYFPLSLIFTAVHMLTMEYFVGLEMLRPVLLFLVLSQSELKKKRAAGQAVLHWLPYLFVLAAYIYWRMAVYPTWIGGQHESNSLYLVSNFIKAPLDTLVTFLKSIFSDLKFLFLSAWSDRLLPDDLPINSITFWLSLLIGFMTIGIAYLLHFHKEEPKTGTLEKKDCWINIGVGFYTILFGMIPVWSTLRQITTGKWSDRFDLATIFGVVFIITTFLFTAFQNQKFRNTLLICLVGLSISFQIRTGNDYRKDFNRQKAFYTQLSWRIPSLEKGTAVYSPGIPTGKEADYSYSMGINLLYEEAVDETFDYWFTGPRYFDAQSLLDDPAQTLEQGLRTFSFTGTGSQVVSIHMPDNGCLWVINPYYALSYTSDAKFPLYAQISNEDLIIDQESGKEALLSTFIDTSPQNTWCYYFEKGDLAQSKGKWEEAISYYDRAVEENLEPLEAVEYFPFIKAYAMSGQIDTAVNLSQSAIKKSKGTQPMLCQFWSELQTTMEVSTSEIDTVYNVDVCPSYFN